ncbi:hypothetical protein M758_12G091500 [Ceratodon purpureus]|nr:hypothetical protein M758_12G091500 [Ceratodon purpureus]
MNTNTSAIISVPQKSCPIHNTGNFVEEFCKPGLRIVLNNSLQSISSCHLFRAFLLTMRTYSSKSLDMRTYGSTRSSRSNNCNDFTSFTLVVYLEKMASM